MGRRGWGRQVVLERVFPDLTERGRVRGKGRDMLCLWRRKQEKSPDQRERCLEWRAERERKVSGRQGWFRCARCLLLLSSGVSRGRRKERKKEGNDGGGWEDGNEDGERETREGVQCECAVRMCSARLEEKKRGREGWCAP